MKNSIQIFLRFFQLRKNNNSIFTKSLSLRFCLVAALSLLAFTGCESDSDVLIIEEESINELFNEVHLSANEGIPVISDGANDGTAGFYFLPPMVKSPYYSGTFDAELSPIVEICETEACLNIRASFSMTEGTGSEFVRLDNISEHFIVNWHTQNTNALAGETYHLRIRVDDAILGYVRINIVSTGREAVEARSDGSVALIEGQTLPVKFRIETGIPGAVVVTPVEASIKVGETQQFTAAVSDLHGVPLSNQVITWGSDDTNLATVDDFGMALGLSEGETNIIATSGPTSGGAALTVTAGSTEAFVTIWDTSLGSGTRIALALAGEVNATIDWGDGTTTDVNEPGPHIHDYGQDGIYTVSVSGSVSMYNTYSNGNISDGMGGTIPNLKLIEVVSWGNVGFESLLGAFYGARNLIEVPATTEGIENVSEMGMMFMYASSFNPDIGAWDTSNVTNMSSMFRGSSFNQNIGSWDVSNVTNMSGMFMGSVFNQDIRGWDTSNVTNMSGMFRASSFNQNIGSWNVSNVTNMSGMFMEKVSAFPQEIGKWDTSNVTNMSNMFWRSNFNQDISGWNTSNVTDMSRMFADASVFNQDISGWDTSNVTNMANMFSSTQFNQDISGWDTSNVTNMSGLFSVSAFNQDISGWNISNVLYMYNMFAYSPFNQDIGNWDISHVTHIYGMFTGASFFNQDIGAWDISNVNSLNRMFLGATAFNKDIGSWDTSNIYNMDSLFQSASSFNQDIGDWNTSNVTRMYGMFKDASSFNQDLSGWCVSNFGFRSAPNAFDEGATSWLLPRPIWGICPTN